MNVSAGEFTLTDEGILGPAGYINGRGAELFNAMMDGDDAAYNTVVQAGGDPYQAIVNRLHLDYVSGEHAARMVASAAPDAQPSLF